MSMPKGFKSKNGYATTNHVANGMGYREIAELMTDEGFKMNHSTARNVFLSSMKKLVVSVCDLEEKVITDEDMYRIASDPRFQSGIYDILIDSSIDV